MAKGFSSQGFSGFQKESKLGGGAKTAGRMGKYYKDYGFRMTPKGYEEQETMRTKFEKQVADYRKAADAKINEAKGLYAQNEKALNAAIAKAKADLGAAPTVDSMFNSWFNKDQVNVNIVDNTGTKILSSRRLPRSFAAGIAGKAPGSAWVDGGKGLNFMPTREAYSILGQVDQPGYLKSVFVTDPNVQGAYAKGIQQYNSAASALSAAEAKQRQALAEMANQITEAENYRDTNIGTATAKREGELEGVRQGYLKGKEKRMKAYGHLAGAQWKSGRE